MIVDISNWSEDFPEGSELTVTIKKMTFGEFSDLNDAVADFKMVGNQQIINTYIGRAKILTLLKSIKKAPFPITEQGIRDLPCDLGDYLYDLIEEMNDTSKNLNG